MEDKINQIAEDVAYIKAKIEVIPVHEDRLRALEKRVWGIPASLIAAVLAVLGIQQT
jgi:hypothetical protein